MEPQTLCEVLRKVGEQTRRSISGYNAVADLLLTMIQWLIPVLTKTSLSILKSECNHGREGEVEIHRTL